MLPGPEMVAAQMADARSDVYSLALVLYLIFSGNRFPFDVADPESPGQWLKAHAEARPRALRELRPEAPEPLDALLLRALAKDPRQRPSAGELLTLLDPDLRLSGVATVVLTQRPALAGWRGPLLTGALLLAGLAIAFVRSPPVGGPAATRTPGAPTPPAPTPATSDESIAVRLAGDLLTLSNRRGTPLTDVELTLLGPAGERYHTRLAAALGPQEDVDLALHGFTPPPPAGFSPRALELETDEAGTRTRQVLALP
jgi:hypothetical protein